jgi:hypothetical protein
MAVWANGRRAKGAILPMPSATQTAVRAPAAAASGVRYYWKIVLPGSVLGLLVGCATQRWGGGVLPRSAVNLH